ncbi:MAG: MFS transporter [Cryobacterium sp.]|nr:MFS transporter [Cryobacterium sp.]
MTDDDRPPLRQLFLGPRGRLLAALLLAEFAASVTGLSYAAVLPVAATELDGLALFGPAVTITGVVSIAFLAFGAYLYGKIGAQAQLGVSTVVLILGVVLTVAATQMELLVAGLALRGVAAGLMGGLGMGVLSDLFPDAKERERAFGLYALMWVAPALVGPAINGLLLVTLGWRASMAWPAVLVLIARALMSRNLRAVGWERPPAPAKVSAPWAFVSIATGLIAAPFCIVTATPAGVAIGAILLVAVVIVPFRRALRLTVPGELRAQSGGWILALVCGSYFGISAFVPLLSATYVDDTGVVGTILVSVGPLTWALTSAGGLGTRLSDRQSYRLAAITFPLAAAFVAMWAFGLTEGALVGALGLGLITALIGAAMGVVYPRVMTLTFEGFIGANGTNRAHGGVVLGIGEDVGTATGATVLAGIGALAIGMGTIWVASLAGVFALFLIVGWAAARSKLWQP